MTEAVGRVHALRPDVEVGVCSRYEDRDAGGRDCVPGSADCVGLALVLNPPGDGWGHAREVVRTLLAELPQPVAIVEAGWPGSERFGSSEACQAQMATGAPAGAQPSSARKRIW